MSLLLVAKRVACQPFNCLRITETRGRYSFATAAAKGGEEGPIREGLGSGCEGHVCLIRAESHIKYKSVFGLRFSPKRFSLAVVAFLDVFSFF